MPYGVGAFMLFGLGSLPAGRLGDLWGRRQMMLVFFFGMGASALLVAATRNAWQLAGALTLMGAFSSIYHPVGIPMLVRGAPRPGLDDRHQRPRRQSRRRAGRGDHRLAGQVRRLARGVRRAGAARDRAAALLFARVAPREPTPPAHGARTPAAPDARAARAHLRRHDGRGDRVEPAVQLHHQRQRPAAARALRRHRRGSGAAGRAACAASMSSRRSRRSRSASLIDRYPLKRLYLAVVALQAPLFSPPPARPAGRCSRCRSRS